MNMNPIEFELVCGLIVVNAAANGKPVRFVVDAGASQAMLTTALVAAMRMAIR